MKTCCRPGCRRKVHTKDAVYCSRKCSAIDRERLRRKGIIPPRRNARQLQPCIECGKQFKPPNHASRYCSRACSARGTSQFRYHRPTLRVPSKDTDRAYLAAIIDGEGFISAGYQRETSIVKAYFVGVTNTDLGLIEWLVGLGGRVTPKKVEANHKPCYTWHVRAAADVLLLLAAVSPYMRIKREKALTAMSELSVLLTAKGLDLSEFLEDAEVASDVTALS